MLAPATSPLPEAKHALVAELLDGLNAPAVQWLSGYMAGAASLLQGPASVLPEAVAGSSAVLSIVYGSQTGNSKRVAEKLAQRAEADGLAVRLLRADSYPTRELKSERLLYVVISTHSNETDVEPPDDARALFEFITGPRAPKLHDLEFAVLGLGDSSYPDFCGIARRLDERLLELGGRRIHDRGEADVDVESTSTPWLEVALTKARDRLGNSGLAHDLPQAASMDEEHREPAHSSQRSVARSGSATVTPLRPRPSTWAHDKPFAAEVLLNQPIVAGGGERNVHHLELALGDSELDYQPGDAVGVWPTQSALLVEAVLGSLALDADSVVEHGGEQLPLSRWLGERRELTRLTRPFLAAHAERGDHAGLRVLLRDGSRDELVALFESDQLIDVLDRYPSAWDPASLVAALRPLAPRLYSIASSRKAVEDEVHLTVADVQYQLDGSERWGVASRFLLDRTPGEQVPIYIEHNPRFRLPADADRDIIMIGPGSGVAPFRGFVQERQAVGGRGRNWLLFGNRHRRTDFLYQLEWQAARKHGGLHRLDVAFSRDQEHKVYVQDRLMEHGREVYAWLENGAHVYVCGDAARMAGDVHSALTEVVAAHGGKSREEAQAWLLGLMTAGRYARDVY